MKTLSKARLADLGLFYCALVWGATFFMVKGALAGVHPVPMVAYRFLLGAALLLPSAVGRGLHRQLGEGFALALLLAALYVSQTVGLLWTSAGNSAFITGMFIVFVPLFLFVFFRERPTGGELASLGAALTGLWMLTGGVSGFNRGDAWTLVAAGAYAGHLLVTDRFVRARADKLLLAFHQFWMTGALCLGASLALGLPLGVAGVKTWGVLAFLGVVPTLTAFFIQLWAQQHAPPVRVALIFTFEPVFGAAFAWTLGGEAFRPLAAAGGALIVLAMVLSEASKLELLGGRKREVLPV